MKFINSYSKKFVSDKNYDDMIHVSEEIHRKILNKSCLGNDMMGWFDINNDTKLIKEHSERISSSSDVVFVIGIGGSYLGARASIEFLNSKYKDKVYFLGFMLDPEYINNVFNKCEDKDIHVIVISKSGNTIEIKATLQIVIEYMKKKYKNNLKDKFTAITGNSGFLNSFAKENNWEILNIPKNIGGRYSVLTNVGLLPISIAGGDIDKILRGALKFREEFLNFDIKFYEYAILRNLFYKSNLYIELFCSFSSRMTYFIEWIKQLFGESEGKEDKGIFPSSLMFSTDLHSLGQFIQEGNKIIFETIFTCKKNQCDVSLDNKTEPILNFNSFNDINEKILQSVVIAHNEGNTPVNLLEIDEYSEEELGSLIFYFEVSCWISSLFLDVNPSNQPGVQKYKENLSKMN